MRVFIFYPRTIQLTHFLLQSFDVSIFVSELALQFLDILSVAVFGDEGSLRTQPFPFTEQEITFPAHYRKIRHRFINLLLEHWIWKIFHWRFTDEVFTLFVQRFESRFGPSLWADWLQTLGLIEEFWSFGSQIEVSFLGEVLLLERGNLDAAFGFQFFPVLTLLLKGRILALISTDGMSEVVILIWLKLIHLSIFIGSILNFQLFFLV